MNNRSFRSFFKIERSVRKKLGELWSPAQMNKWGFGKLLNTALIIQLVAFIAILLDIPFLRQVIGFIYLSFLPGFLFLKIIKLDRTSWIENILFSAGISIAILMLIGVLSSILYPALNVFKPLSALPLIATIFALTLVLYVVSYRKTKGVFSLGTENLTEQTGTKIKVFPVVPLLVCIPILTILGTQLLLNSGNNFILLLLVIITSAISICTFSRRIVPPETYLLAVLVISIFLLFQMSLTSNYIIGYDVHLEYYLANLTSNKSMWDITIPDEYNAMLSVTVLPVIFSNFLNLDLNWVFKAIYPLIFCLVPLSLFVIYKKLTSSRIAFLSVFFFVSLEVFYFTMLGLTRQIIAELFFALLILLIVEDKINLSKRRLLFVIFSAGLIVSHYALSYIFLFFILSAFFLSRFFKRSDGEQRSLITGGMVTAYLAIIFVWYIIVVPSPFDALTFTLNNIRQSILNNLASPGLYTPLPFSISPLHNFSQYLFYGLQLSVVVGLFGSIVSYKKTKFGGEYLTMSIASFVVLVLCIVVPSFAQGFVMSRFYHIASFLLAPFMILGIPTFFAAIVSSRSHLPTSKLKRMHIHMHHVNSQSVGLLLISLLLVLLFLFQVGFIYEVTGDRPSSLSLSYKKLQDNPSLALEIWAAQTPEKDVSSAKWLSKHTNDQAKVYSDKTSALYVLTSYGLKQTVYYSAHSRVGTYNYILSNTSLSPAKDAYIYLRTLNVVYGLMNEGGSDSIHKMNTTAISLLIADCDGIYTNGGSQIYKNPP